MPIPRAMVGDVFGRLTISARIRGARRNCVCVCSCGNTVTVVAYSLTDGLTRSCGCLRKEQVSSWNLQHGEARVGKQTTEFRIWLGMIDRCHNPRSYSYARYGGRG